jgi:asparagine synthase (glutamine-hydrolysing)
MIGFAGIWMKNPSWQGLHDAALKPTMAALQGVEHSEMATIELTSARGLHGKLLFLTARIKPVVVDTEAISYVLYGNLYRSDLASTETIFHDAVHQECGLHAMAKGLNGGFTLFVLDKRTGFLQVFRDRGGIKPVFYHHTGEVVLLSSGLRGIAKSPLFEQKQISPLGLWTNITYPAPTQPLTCFEHVKVIERGGWLSINGSIKSGRYWEIPSHKYDEHMSFDEAVQLTHQAIDEATRIRVSGSGKIGSTLSGGVDSAYLTVLAHAHNPQTEAYTFKVKGEAFEAVNEDDVASMTAKKHGILHHVEAFEFKDFTSELKTLVHLYEQPGLSLGAYYSIAGIAHKLGFNEVINGLSADEQFGGFHYFKHLEYWQWLRMLNPIAKALPANRHKGIDKFRRIAGAQNIDAYYSRSFASYLDAELAALFERNDIHSLDIQQSLYNPRKVDFVDPTAGLMHYMFSNCPNHHLYRFETFSNHFGITPIYPFLDNGVTDLAFTIPSKHKVLGHRRKIVLKKAAEPHVVKPALTEAKRGVGAPVNAWMDNKLKQLTEEKINQLKERGIFNNDYIDRVVMHYPAGYGKKIWKLVMTELWFETFVDA